MKTGLFKMAALGWLFVTEQRLIVWSAHEMKTTKEAFLDLENLICGSPVLAARLAGGPSNGISRGNGEESIKLATGQRIMFKARTNGGGRGLTGDKVILDEAFALKPSHMGSLLPTLSARPDPQVVYGSSAGLAESGVLRGIRDRGRAGDDPSLAYLEWCDDLGGDCASASCEHQVGVDGCRLDDPARWQRANPAMGRRITAEYIAAERRALPPAEFARERLGWWDESTGEAVIAPVVWADGFDTTSEIVGAPYLGLDVAPNRGFAAVAVAGLNGAKLQHLELTQHNEVVDHREGTQWVLPRLVELKQRWGLTEVTIAAGSAAESLVPALEQAGFTIKLLSSSDVSAAAGLFYDLVNARKVKHSGQPALTDAVATAQRRNVGDGTWGWGKRKSGDITALCAASWALWAAIEAENMNLHPVNNIW